MFRGKVCLRIIYLFPNVRSPAQTTPVLRRSVFSGQHVRRAEGSEPSSETPSSQGKEVETVVSSLRIDAVAAAGLDISRKHIWEACLDGHVMINGQQITKKSASVKQGDIVEVDTVLKPKATKKGDDPAMIEEGWPVKRGRVVVKEIGERTRKGSYHMTLVRYKQFALMSKKHFGTFVVPMPTS